MSTSLKITKTTCLGFAGLFAVLMLLKYVFELTLIYKMTYDILAGIIILSGLAFIFLKLISKKRYKLLVASIIIVIILIATPIVILFPFLHNSFPPTNKRIYYETVESKHKVYFETDGFFFMSEHRYYCFDEADVKLWIFYTNRKIIKGGP